MATGNPLAALGEIPTVAPLTSAQPGQSTAAGGVQPGVVGPTPGAEAAQPLPPATQPAAAPQPSQPAVPAPAAQPGKTAEERIQDLTALVTDLRGQLSKVEEIDDLKDDFQDVLAAVKSLQAGQLPQPTTPRPTQPTDVMSYLNALGQKLVAIEKKIESHQVRPDEAVAAKAYVTFEDQVLKTQGIVDPEHQAIVKDMITKEMDRGNHNWARRSIARRVIMGQVDNFKQLQGKLTAPRPVPTAPAPIAAPTVSPVTAAVAHVRGQSPQPQPAPQPVHPQQEPLSQAHQELGPVLAQIFKGGGGVTK